MKRLVIPFVFLFAMMAVPLVGLAEDEHHPAAPAEKGGEQPAVGQGSTPGAMRGGMMGRGTKGGMMAEGMMGCPMMAGAMVAGDMDTATMARMLRMRGEILKAVGEIMLKHGQAMAEEK